MRVRVRVGVLTASVILVHLLAGPAAAGVTADIAVTIASPNTVRAGENITYTITVENLGPSPATNASMGGPEFSGPIPAGTTFVSFTAPAGWTTTISPPVGGTGILEARTPSLAVANPQVFTLVVHVDPTLQDGYLISSLVSAGSITADPDILNNGYTATSVVAGPVASLPSGAVPEPDLSIPLVGLGFVALLAGLLTTTAVLAVRRRRI